MSLNAQIIEGICRNLPITYDGMQDGFAAVMLILVLIIVFGFKPRRHDYRHRKYDDYHDRYPPYYHR